MVVSVSVKLSRKNTQPSTTFLKFGLYSQFRCYVDFFYTDLWKPAWMLASQGATRCHGRGNFIQPS